MEDGGGLGADDIVLSSISRKPCAKKSTPFVHVRRATVLAATGGSRIGDGDWANACQVPDLPLHLNAQGGGRVG